MREPAAAAVRPTSMASHPAAVGGCIVACLLAASAWIRQRSVRSGPGDRGPRELRLPERVSIRIVPGVRPGRPADAGRGRGLVRPARRRGWRPCAGLAGRQPPWPQRDRPIWARSHSTSSRDPTGHGRSTAVAGVPELMRHAGRMVRTAVRPTRSAQSAPNECPALSWPRHDSGGEQIGSVSMSRRQRCPLPVGLLVKCGDLGQAIEVLCTRAAARAERPDRVAGRTSIGSRRELPRRLRGPRPRSLGMDPALPAAVEFAC